MNFGFTAVDCITVIAWGLALVAGFYSVPLALSRHWRLGLRVAGLAIIIWTLVPIIGFKWTQGLRKIMEELVLTLTHHLAAALIIAAPLILAALAIGIILFRMAIGAKPPAGEGDDPDRSARQ